MPIIQVRVFFAKTGRLKYISHLDLMSVFSRAINRSKLPVWYTEGYNQHIYLSFPFPLSLGYEGLKESFEFRLVEAVDFNEIKERLNKLLPPELAISKVGVLEESFQEVDLAQYKIALLYPEETKEELSLLEDSLKAFLGKEEIIVEKRTKRNIVELDIAPYLKLLETSTGSEQLHFSLLLSAGIYFNINPRLVVAAFEKAQGKKAHHMFVTREEFFTKAGRVYQ